MNKVEVELYRLVAEALGNTPAVCRAYYVHPRVLETYREGIFFEFCNQVA